MNNLIFKEVNSEELNGHVTDFWIGVGIGATIVGVVVT